MPRSSIVAVMGALFAAVIIIAAVLVVVSDERNLASLTSPEGRIVDGSKFGVSIGQTSESAHRAMLQDGFIFDGAQNGGGCVRHVYEPTELVEAFSDRSWRNGTVCVVSRGSHVVAVEWFFAPLKPGL